MNYKTGTRPVSTRIEGVMHEISIDTPQWESIEEFIETYGKEAALAYINRHYENLVRMIAREQMYLGATDEQVRATIAKKVVIGT